MNFESQSDSQDILPREPKQKYLLLAAIVLFPALLRWLGQPWNLTPVGGMAIFAGAYVRNLRWAIVLPLAAMVLSDLTWGYMKGDLMTYTFHRVLPFVYGSYVLYVLFGHRVRSAWSRPPGQTQSRFLRRLRARLPVGLAAVAGSVCFFLITNFGMWLMYQSYPHTPAGLIQCYVAGLPFLLHTMIGDGFYTGLFFGLAFAVQAVAVSTKRDAVTIETI